MDPITEETVAPATTEKTTKKAPKLTYEEEFAALVKAEADDLAKAKQKVAVAFQKAGLREEDMILPHAATELEKYGNLLRAAGGQKGVIITGGSMPDPTGWLQDYLGRGFVAVPRTGHIALY